MRTLLSRLTYANVTATIALVLGLTGGAYAAVSSGAPHTIRACYSNRTGSLRRVKGSAHCARHETPIAWNSAGVRGPQGPAGQAGATGATGATGAAGAAGPKGDKGDQGIQGIQGIQGNQGIHGNQGIQGDPGPAGPTVSASATGNSSTTVVSGTQTIASTNITLPAGVNTVVANAGFDWISDAAGSSTLGCQLGLDTTVAPFIQEGTSSSSPGFALTARFTGLSAGSHIVKLICINDGGTPAIGPNPTITAVGTGG